MSATAGPAEVKVNLDRRSPAEEARMPAPVRDAPAATWREPDARAARIRAARNRLLPYVVAGGAVVGGYLNVVAAGRERLEAVFMASVTAGIMVGMALGWLSFGLFGRWAGRATTAGRRLDLVVGLLTAPAYIAAAWTATVVGWAAVVLATQAEGVTALPNAWPLLLLAAVVLYPISAAFALRDTTRPDDFAGAVASMRSELNQPLPRTFGMVGQFLLVLAWLGGTLVALVVGAWGIQVVLADQLRGLQIPTEAGFAFLAAWIGMAVAGTLWTLRRMDRRRRRQRR